MNEFSIRGVMLKNLPGSGLGSSGNTPWREAVELPGPVPPSFLPPLSFPPPLPGLRQRRPEMCGSAGAEAAVEGV